VVALSVAGGQPGVVTVPETVTIPANQKQATFPITVTDAPQATVAFAIAATLTVTAGRPSTAKATLTVHNLTGS
jgi:hypothetical protein